MTRNEDGRKMGLPAATALGLQCEFGHIRAVISNLLTFLR